MKQNYEKSLSKALDILVLFLNSKEELSLSEICNSTGLNKSTVSRLTSTLVEYDFLKQPEFRGRFSLGTIYLGFSGLIKSRIPLRKVAIPYLLKLSGRIGEAVVIAYGNGSQRVFSESYYDASVHTPLLIAPDENTAMPLHSTAIGKIMLAYMSDGEVEKYFNDNKLDKNTSNTIVDMKEFKSQLAIVRQQGVAYDFEEFQTGTRGVASGIRGDEGSLIGGIAVVAPAVRFPSNQLQDIANEVKSCANEISIAMGFRGNLPTIINKR